MSGGDKRRELCRTLNAILTIVKLFNFRDNLSIFIFIEGKECEEKVVMCFI